MLVRTRGVVFGGDTFHIQKILKTGTNFKARIKTHVVVRLNPRSLINVTKDVDVNLDRHDDENDWVTEKRPLRQKLNDSATS